MENPSGLQCRQELGWELERLGELGAVTDGTPFSSQTSQKSCEAEPRGLPSQSLLQEDDPEPPSRQLQATGSRGSEPRSNLDLSDGPLVALEYLPFFRTYGQLLAEEEPAPRPEVCRDRGGDQSIREEDSEPPSGFFPHYRSKEERFPSLALPGRWCSGSRDPPTRRELRACCPCRTTVCGKCSVSWGGHRGCRVQHCGPWQTSVPGPHTPGGLTRPPRSVGAPGAACCQIRAQSLEAGCLNPSSATCSENVF